MNATIVDVLIENIKTDQTLLGQTDAKIESAKDEKRAVVERLKDYRRDIMLAIACFMIIKRIIVLRN